MNGYQINFDSERSTAHLAQRWRSLFLGPGYPWTFDIVSTAMTLLLAGVLLLLSRTVLQGRVGAGGLVLTVVIAVVVVVNLVGALIAGVLRLVRYRRAVQERRGVGEGLAMILDAAGIQTADGAVPWEQVQQVRVDKPGFGHTWQVVVDTAQGEFVRWPLHALEVAPERLSVMVHSCSGGRFGIDLRPIDDDVPGARSREKGHPASVAA